MTEEDLEFALADAITQHFRVTSCDYVQTWVLSTEYEWSARQIAKRSSWTDFSDEEFEREELDVLRDVGRAEKARNGDGGFENHADAERVYLWFRFIAFEQSHRGEALPKSAQIRAICGDRFFCDTMSLLGISSHEMTEICVAASEQERSLSTQ